MEAAKAAWNAAKDVVGALEGMAGAAGGDVLRIHALSFRHELTASSTPVSFTADITILGKRAAHSLARASTW